MTGFLFLFDAYLPGWQKVPSLVITTSGKLNFFFFCATCFSCLAQCRVTNLRTNAYEAGFVGIHDLCRGPFYVDRSLSLACTMHFFFSFLWLKQLMFQFVFQKSAPTPGTYVQIVLTQMSTLGVKMCWRPVVMTMQIGILLMIDLNTTLRAQPLFYFCLNAFVAWFECVCNCSSNEALLVIQIVNLSSKFLQVQVAQMPFAPAILSCLDITSSLLRPLAKTSFLWRR